MMKNLILFLSLILIVSACSKGTLSDGIYKESEKNFDSKGWKAVLVISIENSEITKVFYDEINKDGVSKRNDLEYKEKLKAAEGISPAEVFTTLESELFNTQSVEAVDTITGATVSSARFINLAKKILK